MIRNFLREEEALTTVEYGILLAALTVFVVAGIFALFGNLGGVFQAWGTWFKDPSSDAPDLGS